MSGFDSADEAASAANYDSFEFSQVLNVGTAEDSDVQVQTTYVHDSSNGGNDSSNWAMLVSVTTGEQAYYEPAPLTKCEGGTNNGEFCDEESDCAGTGGDCLREGTGTCEDGAYTKCTDDSDCGSYSCRRAVYSPFPLFGVYEMTVAANIHLETAPTADRRVLAIIEEDGAIGCNLKINSDKALEVYYGDTLLGTPAFVTHKYSCDTPYEYLPCDEDSDCPTDCTHDVELRKYWAGLELRELSYGNAACTVYLRGHRFAHWDSVGVSTATQIRTFAVGALDTAASALEIWVDDVVACADDRCGFGYVASMFPTSDGAKQWSTSGSTAGCGPSYHYECLDDYDDTAEDPDYTYGSPTIVKAVANKVDVLDDFTQTIGFDATTGMSIDALSLVAFGRDGDSAGVREFKLTLGEEEWALDSPTVSLLNTSDNHSRLLASVMTPNLTMGSDGYYSQTGINTIQAKVTTSPNITQNVLVGALVVYAHVMRPGDPLPDVIPDDNYGTDDGMVTIVASGDSTTNQTLGGICIGGGKAGLGCTWETYCSWEPLKDQPSGGCNDDDDMCHSCGGRRADVPGGAGYHCDDSDPSASTELCRSVCDDNPEVACDEDGDCGTTCVKNECTDVGGECGQTWCCSKNLVVPCTTSTDCEALLGCNSTATCEDSCPDGTCPPPNAWISRLKNHVHYDNLIQCAQGATGSLQMDYKWDNALTGLYAGYAGFGTACEDNTDCALVAPHPSVCRANGYCSNCALVEGVYAPGDLYISLIGVNDSVTGPHAPNCEGPFAGVGKAINSTYLGLQLTCSPPSQENCVSDTQCNDKWTGSKCIGRSSTDSKLCAGSYEGYGVSGSCSVYRLGCNTDADCPTDTTNGTCSTNESWYTYRGSCGCSLDSECEAYDADFKCVNNICRRKCDNQACSGCDGDHVCVGGANDGLACNVASDCPGDNTSCSMWCGFDGGCNTVADANVCYGTCTYPSAAKSCSLPSDCNSIVANPYSGGLGIFEGNCVSSHCECNGVNICPNDSTCNAEYVGGWLPSLRYHHAALDRFKGWQDDVAALSEPGSRPRLLFLTVPDTHYPECWMTRGDKQYVNKMNAHLMLDARCATGSEVGKPCYVDSDCPGSGDCQRRFTNVVDTAHTFLQYSKSDLYPPEDPVHFNAYAAGIIGDRVGEWIAGWHTCALDAGTPQQRPQWFCRYANDTWTSTTCTLDTEITDCVAALGSVCQVRYCSSEDDCPGASTCNLTF